MDDVEVSKGYDGGYSVLVAKLALEGHAVPVKYQLHKPELLINTDWGHELKAMTPDEAREQGLIRWNDRWVSPEDKRRIQKEHRVYAWIHLTVLLSSLGGLGGFFLGAYQLSQSHWVEGGIQLYIAGLVLVMAWMLREYHPWGRVAAVVAGGWNVLSAVLAPLMGMNTGFGLAVVWHVVWLVVIARLFFSPIGNVIFTRGPIAGALIPEVGE